MEKYSLFLVLIILSFFLNSSSCSSEPPTPSVKGCLDNAACNYNSSATESDGSCEYNSCSGCMDENACNYDSSATQDDGSCEYETCAGCTDENACNYDSNAIQDDGSCESTSCSGCTDENACNYDSSATKDNGSCDFSSCEGCMDPDARNYDPSATIDSGNCDYSCTLTGIIGDFIVIRTPSNNVNIKFEVYIDGVLVIRTVNKRFTTVGNNLYFDQNDYDYNLEGANNVIRFPETGGVMTIKIFVNDVLTGSTDYNTCYIEGNISIQGNIVPQYYYVGGPNCGNGGCEFTAGIRFESVVVQ